MRVELVAAKAGANTLIDKWTLKERLTKESVYYGIDNDAIEMAFAHLGNAEEGAKFLIASGIPAKHGQNGFVEFLVNVSGRPIYDGTTLSDEDAGQGDTIDYKNATPLVGGGARADQRGGWKKPCGQTPFCP